MHIYLPLSLDLFNDISSVFKLIFQKFCLNVLRGSILVKMYVTYLIGGGGGGTYVPVAPGPPGSDPAYISDKIGFHAGISPHCVPHHRWVRSEPEPHREQMRVLSATSS